MEGQFNDTSRLDTSTSLSAGLNAGLTQVLSDGTNTYLYGNGRVGELQPGGFAYHLGDALGSVRQLTDASGAVTLARSFEPYGETLSSAGSRETIYQYTGEIRDASGLTFLRARYLNNQIGRLISRDTWAGNAQRPMSHNAWLYVYADPVNLTDPSGQDPWCKDDPQACQSRTQRTPQLFPNVCVKYITQCRELRLSNITRRESWLGVWLDTDPFVATGRRQLGRYPWDYHDGINWGKKRTCPDGIPCADGVYVYNDAKVELRTVVFHHGGPEVAADPSNGASYMLKAHEWHIDPTNPLEDIDIDYHFGISATGEILEGRPISIRGQHVAGANTGRLGILMAGNFNDYNNPVRPTQAQIDSAIRLINDLKALGYHLEYVAGHREFPGINGLPQSECPGDFFQVQVGPGQYANALDYIAEKTKLSRDNIPGTIGADNTTAP